MATGTFYIGVGGHQDLGDEATQHFVAEQFRQLLMNFQASHTDIVLYSALALGADQLFIRGALELNIPVEAVLPCMEYEANYASDQERLEYQRLLHACQNIHQLPYQNCSGDAYRAAGHWIVAHSDISILAWNGFPAQGRGGTADMASYARLLKRPFVHIHTRHHTVSKYGELAPTSSKTAQMAPKREFVTATQPVYQGETLTVKQHRVQMPDGEELVRDTVELPERVLILPVCQGRKELIVLLIEEYDFGAGTWQLTLPGGKIEPRVTLEEQAQQELRQEIGYKAGRLEKLVELHSHPGYIAQKVHILLASDLEWEPLEAERYEEIKVHTFTLEEALAATAEDQRFDPEAALALLIFNQMHRTC
ncbi:NUDIX hydrolase [Ktedonosporobacter rubrisoli]|nr:NUDIX hydrolase [Ktedonosporobacter rubrisoli]